MIIAFSWKTWIYIEVVYVLVFDLFKQPNSVWVQNGLLKFLLKKKKKILYLGSKIFEFISYHTGCSMYYIPPIFVPTTC